MKKSASNPDKITIEVKDNGIGIAPEELPHIFERSFRAKEGKEYANGSGLGLAISKGFAEMHKGTISVQSEVGKGSVFCIEFPME